MIFKLNLDKSKLKPSKIWVAKGSRFCSRSMKTFLLDNDIQVFSTHNEGKSVITERFIRILENKIYKYMTLLSKMRIFLRYMA